MYPTRAEITPEGETRHDVDNTWILGYKPNTMLIASDKAQIASDGVEVATITIQLRTPILVDGSYQDVLQSETVKIQIDDGEADVTLDANGVGTTTINSIDVGTFEIRGITYDSNIVQLEVV